jgi:hypothetical protein
MACFRVNSEFNFTLVLTSSLNILPLAHKSNFVPFKMDLREVGWGGAWTGSIWLRIGTGGGLL